MASFTTVHSRESTCTALRLLQCNEKSIDSTWRNVNTRRCHQACRARLGRRRRFMRRPSRRRAGAPGDIWSNIESPHAAALFDHLDEAVDRLRNRGRTYPPQGGAEGAAAFRRRSTGQKNFWELHRRDQEPRSGSAPKQHPRCDSPRHRRRRSPSGGACCMSRDHGWGGQSRGGCRERAATFTSRACVAGDRSLPAGWPCRPKPSSPARRTSQSKSAWPSPG
jgi:hypothetical protein